MNIDRAATAKELRTFVRTNTIRIRKTRNGVGPNEVVRKIK